MPRGGKRDGAGRPTARTYTERFAIGQACEVLYRQASDSALAERKRQMFEQDTRLQELWDRAKAIPLEQRKAWLREHHGDHRDDVEAWLHELAQTPFDETTGDYHGKAPRLVRLSTRPPKGTRAEILGVVSGRFAISKNTADRLWKAYRTFERDAD